MILYDTCRFSMGHSMVIYRKIISIVLTQSNHHHVICAGSDYRNFSSKLGCFPTQNLRSPRSEFLVPFYFIQNHQQRPTAHLSHFHKYQPSNIWIPPEKSNIQRKRIKLLILTLQEMKEFTIFHFWIGCLQKSGITIIPKYLKKTLEPDYKPISSHIEYKPSNFWRKFWGNSIILPSSFPSFWDQRDPLDQFFNLRSQARGFRLTELDLTFEVTKIHSHSTSIWV